jgi:transcriptional regulator with XRE-family HTH domain
LGHQVDPMVQRRRLRADLQQMRVRLGLTQQRVADDLGWSLSKLIRVENGKVGVSRTDLKALLQLYGVTDTATVDNYVKMAEQGRKQRWSAYRDVLNPEFFRYLEFEGSASSIRQFQPHFIPGLLQTERYARYLSGVNAGVYTGETLDRQMEVRTARLQRLTADGGPTLEFVLDEAVIRRFLGIAGTAPEIVAEQVAHLREVAGRPTVTIRIIPFDHGPYRGGSTPFILLGFPDPEDGDLLFRESGDLLYRENGADSEATRSDPRLIEQFATQFEHLSSLATAPDQLAGFLSPVVGPRQPSSGS